MLLCNIFIVIHLVAVKVMQFACYVVHGFRIAHVQVLSVGRMCAVFGGVYHLSRGVEALVFDSESDQCRGIVSRGIFLRCSCVVLNAGSFAVSPDTVTAPDISGRGVSRAILLLDAPLYWANVTVDEDLLTLVRLPAGICQLPVSATVLQFSSSSAAVPEGLCKFYNISNFSSYEIYYYSARIRLYYC